MENSLNIHQKKIKFCEAIGDTVNINYYEVQDNGSYDSVLFRKEILCLAQIENDHIQILPYAPHPDMFGVEVTMMVIDYVKSLLPTKKDTIH